MLKTTNVFLLLRMCTQPSSAMEGRSHLIRLTEPAGEHTDAGLNYWVPKLKWPQAISLYSRLTHRLIVPTFLPELFMADTQANCPHWRTWLKTKKAGSHCWLQPVIRGCVLEFGLINWAASLQTRAPHPAVWQWYIIRWWWTSALCKMTLDLTGECWGDWPSITSITD